ncbi:lipase family protein [Glycomyces rhizosphaerae]|uniref:Lipase family protein n=1 Tax=Glycomyces rhizosphaerae TaxID=2054422 RepID=A0ABV7Q1G9_9ACTN
MTWTPGTLVRHQPLVRQHRPEAAADAYRIQYRGNGFDGEQRLVSGTAFIPAGQAPEDGWPVIGFAHGSTGLSDASAPSRTGFARPELEHIGRWLAAGYAVAATDYEGLSTPGPHPYFNGEAVADDVIDAVRAVQSLNHRIAPAWLVAGYSQGGHAAVHVANIATGYAPELDFRGTIAVAPAACVNDFIAELTAEGSAPLSPIVPLTLAGIAATRTDFASDAVLTPLGAELVAWASRATLHEMCQAVRGIDNDQAGTTGIASHPEIADVLDAVSAPVTYLDRPVFITASRDDEIIPHQPVERFADGLHKAGADVAYASHIGADHAEMLETGQPDAIDFGREHLEAVAAARDVPTQRFDLLDRSGDGRFARDDYDAFALRLARSLGHAPRSPQAAAVRDGYRRLWNAVRTAADTDADGTVSATEYRAWAARESASDGDRSGFATAVRPLAEAVIDLVDDDGSRTLDRTELDRLLTACRVRPDEAAATSAALDADGDGRVSTDEIVDAVRGFCVGEPAPGAWLFGRF